MDTPARYGGQASLDDARMMRPVGTDDGAGGSAGARMSANGGACRRCFCRITARGMPSTTNVTPTLQHGDSGAAESSSLRGGSIAAEVPKKRTTIRSADTLPRRLDGPPNCRALLGAVRACGTCQAGRRRPPLGRMRIRLRISSRCPSIPFHACWDTGCQTLAARTSDAPAE